MVTMVSTARSRFHVVGFMLSASCCQLHVLAVGIAHCKPCATAVRPIRRCSWSVHRRCMPVLMRSRRSCHCAHARGMRTLQLDPEGQLTRKPTQALLPTQRITQSSLQATVVAWHEELPVQ